MENKSAWSQRVHCFDHRMPKEKVMIDLQEFELNSYVGHFASKMSEVFDSSNGDDGPFHSNFCGELERFVVQAFAQFLKELNPKIKKEFEINQESGYLVSHILIPYKQAKELGIEFKAFNQFHKGIINVDDFAEIDGFPLVKIFCSIPRANGFFYIHDENLVSVLETDLKENM